MTAAPSFSGPQFGHRKEIARTPIKIEEACHPNERNGEVCTIVDAEEEPKVDVDRKVVRQVRRRCRVCAEESDLGSETILCRHELIG